MSKEEKIEINKRLVERYPYLMPRNVFTNKVPEDYDYSYIKGEELPDGWKMLFLQMCEDIRQPLIDANYLDKFRFSQIKEKYNEMRCYHFGAPKDVDDILSKYEVMASYVCTQCGRPAHYETQGYLESYCEDCWKDKVRHEKMEQIKFKPYFKVTICDKNGKREETISFEEEWNRYLADIERDRISKVREIREKT